MYQVLADEDHDSFHETEKKALDRTFNLHVKDAPGIETKIIHLGIGSLLRVGEEVVYGTETIGKVKDMPWVEWKEYSENE